MSKRILLFLFLVSSLHADNFTTLDGDKYTNATVKRVEPDGIVVMDNDGVRKLKFSNLPAAEGKKYGYDPVKASLFQSASQAAAISSEANALKQQGVENVGKSATDHPSPASRSYDIRGNVVQRLPQGVLVRAYCVVPLGSRDEGGESTVFVTGVPDDVGIYEGMPVAFQASESGTFQYENVNGTESTVRRFACERPGATAAPPTNSHSDASMQ